MPARKQTKKTESVISFLILVVIISIVLTIILRQFDFGAQQQATQGPAGFEALKTEEYSAENLYEKINGKAPLYLEAGFKKLTTQRFVSTDDQSIWFENYTYDMTDGKNAFSVYSIQKRSNAENVANIGATTAYKTTNGLYFVKGKYYVEIVASAESPQVLDAAMDIAKKMQVEKEQTEAAGDTNRDQKSQISETDLLQADNIIADSTMLYRKEAFGFDGFGDLYAAKYKMADETITAFAQRCKDEKEAGAIADAYRKFLAENGAQTVENTQNQLKNGVFDFYGSYEIIISKANFIIGVHEAQDQKQAEQLVESILKKLEKPGN